MYSFFLLFFTTLDKILFSEMKKDDTFGQDDKDWDVYKEIVSHYVFCLTNIGIIHVFFFSCINIYWVPRPRVQIAFSDVPGKC